ncbi:MAG: EamA family transporter [Acidobacteriota bacterium]
MVYLIIVSFIWGFSFVIIKGSLTSLDSNFVSFFRLLLSLIVFIPFLRPACVQFRDAVRLAAIGSVQFGFMYVAYVASYQYLPAHTIVLMTTTTPLFVSIIHSFYDGKVRKVFLVTACLAVAAGIVLVYPEQTLDAGVYGVVLMQISNVAFAFGQVAYKRFMQTRPSLKDKNVFGYMYAGAVAVAGGFTLIATDFTRLSIQGHQWLALGYLGVIASGICFFLWNFGVRKVHAGSVAVMNNLKIPVGVVASLAILHETTDYPRLIAGCILFAAALWLNARVEIHAADS